MPLLPLKTQVNATTPLYAPAGSGGGGGGGGGGPNISVSTVTFNNGVGFIDGNYECNDGSTPQGISVEVGSSAATLFAGQIALQGLENVTAGVNATLSGGGTGGYPQTTLIADCRGFYITDAGAPTNLYVSSILCSTINGAAPGGGGGAVGPVLSNISTILMNPANAEINLDSGAGPGILTIKDTGTTNENDIRFYTNESANSFVTNFQPGGVGNLIQTINPNGNGSALNFGATDAGGAVLAVADFLNGNASTLTVASDNLKLLQPVASGGTLQLQASDANLYDLAVRDNTGALIARASVGTIGGRNQVYMDTAEAPNFYTSTIKGSTGQISLNPSGTEQIRIGGVGAPGDITIATVGGGNINLTGPVIQSSGLFSVPGPASISSLTVSSINGAVPGGGGGGSLTNSITPWVPGFSLSGQRFLNVDSNTIATPIALTNPVPALTNHSYLVSYNLSSGSNADNSQPTVVTLAIPPAIPMFYASYAGNGTYDYQTTGQTGNRTAIIRGASSIQLLAGCGSATASTLMVLDDTQQFQITDLGVSS